MGPHGSELQFSLTHEGKTQKLALQEGELIHIGRAGRCAVSIDDASVSGQHVELSVAADLGGRLILRARDCSRNGTGIVSGFAKPTVDAVGRLATDEPEEVGVVVQIIVPLRRKNDSGVLEIPLDDARSTILLQVQSHAPATIIPAAPAPDAAPEIVAAHAALLDAMETPVPGAPSPPILAAPVKAPTVPSPVIAPAPSAAPLPDVSQLPDAYDSVTNTGRWRYETRLGEGGLGVVYKATDATGGLGEVAVKVLKRHSRTPHRDARHAFAMHRESQWSLWRLHNEYDSRYRGDRAVLFARYLEDHTGFSEIGPSGFDAKRRQYEAPDFDWEKDGPVLPPQPYVVMELIKGEALQVVIDRERRQPPPDTPDPPHFSYAEKRAVLIQAAKALEYLSLYALIHRDFRGCNMHLVSRLTPKHDCCLKVLDLGVMISAEDGQAANSNAAVQAFRRRGETEEKRRRYDWLPWEVRAGADGTGPAVNFSLPAHSFDVFSLGVLILHLLVGKTEARTVLDVINGGGCMVDTSPLDLDPELVRRMLGQASDRPCPTDIVIALTVEAVPKQVEPLPADEDAVGSAGSNDILDVPVPVSLQAPAEPMERVQPMNTAGQAQPTALDRVADVQIEDALEILPEAPEQVAARDRSRSRERKQRERRERWAARQIASAAAAADTPASCPAAEAFTNGQAQTLVKVPVQVAAQEEQPQLQARADNRQDEFLSPQRAPCNGMALDSPVLLASLPAVSAVPCSDSSMASVFSKDFSKIEEPQSFRKDTSSNVFPLANSSNPHSLSERGVANGANLRQDAVAVPPFVSGQVQAALSHFVAGPFSATRGQRPLPQAPPFPVASNAGRGPLIPPHQNLQPQQPQQRFNGWESQAPFPAQAFGAAPFGFERPAPMQVAMQVPLLQQVLPQQGLLEQFGMHSAPQYGLPMAGGPCGGPCGGLNPLALQQLRARVAADQSGIWPFGSAS